MLETQSLFQCREKCLWTSELQRHSRVSHGLPLSPPAKALVLSDVTSPGSDAMRTHVHTHTPRSPARMPSECLESPAHEEMTLDKGLVETVEKCLHATLLPTKGGGGHLARALGMLATRSKPNSFASGAHLPHKRALPLLQSKVQCNRALVWTQARTHARAHTHAHTHTHTHAHTRARTGWGWGQTPHSRGATVID